MANKKGSNLKRSVIIGLFILGVFGISLFAISQNIGLGEEGSFYQIYPSYDLRSECYADDSVKQVSYSKDAIINTDNSVFKIQIMGEPYQVERSSGNFCAVYVVNYNVIKDGSVIDTVNLDEWVSAIQSAPDGGLCGVVNPVQMKRAYSDDGKIVGGIEELPEGVNGIDVHFSSSAFKDGLSRTKLCRRVHVENSFSYNLGTFDIDLVSQDGGLIIYDIKSSGDYYAEIENKLTFEGGLPKTIKTSKDLVKGDNRIQINIEETGSFNLQTKATLYKKTSEISGVNAVSSLFKPISSDVRFNQNAYFLIGDVDLRTIEIEEIKEVVVEDVKEEVVKEVECNANIECQSACGTKIPTCENNLCFCGGEQIFIEIEKTPLYFYIIPVMVFGLIVLIIWQLRKKPKK